MSIAIPERRIINDVSLQAVWKPVIRSFAVVAETKIELTSATPKAAPICLEVLLRADPIANRACGRNAVAELEIVDIHKPTPIPV